MSQTIQTIKEVISKIKYKDWDILLRIDDKRPYLQIQFNAPDTFTGEMARQHCRKWMLSYYMTNSEIVRTAYKAIEAAVLHEFQEDFKYKGQPIFRPHFDVEALWEASYDNRIDKR